MGRVKGRTIWEASEGGMEPFSTLYGREKMTAIQGDGGWPRTIGGERERICGSFSCSPRREGNERPNVEGVYQIGVDTRTGCEVHNKKGSV